MKVVATLPPMHPGEMLREEFLKLEAIETYKQEAA
jgi:plasmid maintenance system antidote protein VapI